MVETYNGLISQIRNEGRNDGKKEVINDLLKSLPIDVVAVLLSKKKSEIEEILKK